MQCRGMGRVSELGGWRPVRVRGGGGLVRETRKPSPMGARFPARDLQGRGLGIDGGLMRCHRMGKGASWGGGGGGVGPVA